MSKLPKLPVGIENFEEIRTQGFYYVDKTGLIKDLLENWGKVNLFTRPRRFGKSLNMDMLKTFFEYGCDPALFTDLEIAGEHDLCEKHMGQYPVISITLKGVEGLGFEAAQRRLSSIIGSEAMRFQFLSESDILSEKEKSLYEQLVRIGGMGESTYIMTEETLTSSLFTLCALLRKHYNKKVILLIDEYDVPLDKAGQYGYYEEMASLIRGMLGQALKTNGSLHFAVLTGCLRVSKESIFTGLNNLSVFSITNVLFEERFGFSQEEVEDMLKCYGLECKREMVKEWYDGYRFGDVDVYCPWDVVNYMNLLRSEPHALPEAFWMNTSGNDIIRKFIGMANFVTRNELERLVAGESVSKKIKQELTYRDLYSSVDNMWSILFTTGYLTQRGRVDSGVYRLAIPNLEIRQIFIEQIMEWFCEETEKDTPKLDAFCAAILRGDCAEVEERFNAYLRKTISIRDTGARKGRKENFYHGILLGLLSHREDWGVESNAESGEGFSDILVEDYEEGIGIVIEVKYPDGGDLEAGCREALMQIDRMGYASRLEEDGMVQIIKYGIAFYKKRCKVWMEK